MLLLIDSNGQVWTEACILIQLQGMAYSNTNVTFFKHLNKHSKKKSENFDAFHNALFLVFLITVKVLTKWIHYYWKLNFQIYWIKIRLARYNLKICLSTCYIVCVRICAVLTSCVRAHTHSLQGTETAVLNYTLRYYIYLKPQ